MSTSPLYQPQRRAPQMSPTWPDMDAVVPSPRVSIEWKKLEATRVTTGQQIIATTQKVLGVRTIREHTNAAHVSRPRMIAAYLMRDLLHWSYPRIGKALGGFHHTTMMHGIRQVEGWLKSNPEIRRAVQVIREELLEQEAAQ